MNNITIESIIYEEKRLWEIPLARKYKFINNIEEVTKLIEEGKLLNFEVKDNYKPSEKTANYLDVFALQNNIIINYTDDLHNIAYSNLFPTFINTSFFSKYHHIIKEAFIKYIKNSDNTFYTINKYIFSDEIFDILIEKNNVTLYFEDIDLTSDQIKKLQDKFINSYLKKDGENKKISSKYIFGIYTKDKLEEMDNLTLFINDLEENEISHFRYLKDNTLIEIITSNKIGLEEESMALLQKKLKEINALNKKFTIKFDVNKRSIYNKYFNNLELNNLDIIIKNDLYEYPKDEFVKEEEKLNNFVKNIKNSSLSPFEKFIAVYNIVKNIKPYRENEEDKNQARYLRYILNNDYIVCVGYAKLLVELLDKVGINATRYSVNVDVSYDDGFTVEERVVELLGHARVIVNMDDDKYNIHGLYLSDPTWDNNLEKNLFNNALIPFDSMQRNISMFSYGEYNPILDIHNFDEYNEQVNYLLKREIKGINKYSYNKNQLFSKNLINSYKAIAERILSTISCDPKFNYFMKKLSTCNVEKNYIDFYTELGHYLLTRINKKFNENVFFEANKEILKNLDLTHDEMKKVNEINKNIEEDFYKRDIKHFPYEIPNDNKFNLEDKKIL